jgi:predicted permease
MPRFDSPSTRQRIQRCWDVVRAWVRALLISRRRDDQQLRADLDFHLEQAAAEQRRGGLSEQAARLSALKAFGSPARVIDEVREMSPWTALERVVQDLRYGVRGFLRTPAFTVTVVLSLGLAIGANTAIFGVVDAFVFRPLPVHQPEGLFTLRLQGTAAAGGPGRAYELSYPQFMILRDRVPHFAHVAARGGRLDRYNITASGAGGGLDPQQAWIEPVSGNYFSTLGLRASQGRLLTPDDDAVPGASPVAIISHAYWRRRFASAPDVVGRTLAWNDATFVIVGVGPERFAGVTTALATDIWVPLTMQPQAIPEAAHFLTDGAARWVQLVVRLRPDVSVDQANDATNIAWQQVERERGAAIQGERSTTASTPRLELASLARGFQGPRSRFAQPLTIVLIVTMLVLLVACVTVANLVLARSVARAREFAVRRALGASRGRLIRQIVTESALLTCCAGGLGLLLGWWIGTGMPRLLDVDLLAGAARLDVRFDERLLAFAAALCLLSIAIVGLAPVLKSSNVSLTSGLTGARSVGDGATGIRIRRGLVVAQVVVSLVLLTGGGLFVRTLQNLASIDIGTESRDTLIVWTRPGQTALTGRDLTALYDRAAVALSALPGVRAAGFSYGALFPTDPPGIAIESIDGRPPRGRQSSSALYRYASPKMLDAVGLPLIAGRDFSERDSATAPRAAIVNGVLARQFFGTEDPIGRHFRFANSSQPFEIVGVMRDTTFESPREPPRPTFYLSHRQATGSPGGIVWFAVRSPGARPDLPAQIRRTLHDLSSNLAVLSIECAGDVLDRARGQERLLAMVSASFAVVATLLTYVGLYGIIAFTTARRTQEIGLRLALGATRGSVVGSVLRESLVLVLVGVCIGVPAAVATTSLLANRLYGVAATDPMTIAVAATVMVAVALIAGYMPARRASMTAPTVALRCE